MRDSVRRLGAAQDGFTLTEMLVVLVIVGIVLGAIAQLMTSGIVTEQDQTNRSEAQQHARLGLDKLRREIHCASAVTTPSGYPASAVTVTLGSYCQATGGATTVTWCTKDSNGATPPVASAQPYTLWRYVGSTCSGTGSPWASDLVEAPSATAGKIFDASFLPAATLTQAGTGTLPSGTYSYVVTAVVGGAEVPGVVTSITAANAVTLSWPAYSGATYNVYGRDGDFRLLGNTAGTSFVDSGPARLTQDPLTLPTTTINVSSTANFNASSNAIVFASSGVVTCTGTTGTSFTGCSGGLAGQYPQDTPVYSASSGRAPSAKLAVTLAVDATPADAKQRFLLTDDIALRNSRPS